MTKLLEVSAVDDGLTIHLVPHFHFDPVWWNTQAAATSELAASDWSASPRMRFQGSAFDVLRQHLALAVLDADYRFCVAEVDYLEPFWTRHPEHRSLIRRLLAEGRLEVVGGTYNEPATNLTPLSLTRRNLAEGLAFQRGVLGATVATAWQLDVFGHDPSFPSALAAAGLDSVVLARGPYGPWGPMLDAGDADVHDPDGVQFPTEFAWIAPDGAEALCLYAAGHYSTAYRIDEAPTWEDAAVLVVGLARRLRPIAATDHVMLLVGTDVAPPARWVTELPRRFAERYEWPRIRCSLPRDVVAAVRADLTRRGRLPSPQTRDLNPVYTGKDVSYIDTKQAQWAIEAVLADAEHWVTATGIDGSRTDVDDAWRLLVYGAHHDAITGTESDQVYLDLLMGWRHAHDLAVGGRAAAIAALATPPSPAPRAVAIVVANATDRPRRDVVRIELGADVLGAWPATGLRLTSSPGGDAAGDVAFVAEAIVGDPAGRLAEAVLTALVDVPAGGHVTVWALPDASLPRWTPRAGSAIANEFHELGVDAARGGCIVSWRQPGCPAELVAPGRAAGDLVLVAEHPTHPVHGEGPWHLLPKGELARSSDAPASVAVQRSPIGERVVASGSVASTPFVSTTSLWNGVDRVDVTVDIETIGGTDHLVRVEWPLPVAGALPVVDTGAGPIGRGWALIDADAADHPWTLETPARQWFGTSVTCRVDVESGACRTARAIAVAEVVIGDDRPASVAAARRVVTALAAAGVTATTTTGDGPRYGRLGLDSNAPDVRIALTRGLGGDNRFADEVLAAAPLARELVAGELGERGAARVWITADRPLREAWVAGLDVRGAADLPVLVVAGADDDSLDAEVAAIADELQERRIGARGPADATPTDEPPEPRTVAVVHRGTPSCAVTPDGTLVSTVLRACSAWPAGQWIDPPKRTAPDGSSFQAQHWSHRVELSVVARPGDWRDAAVAADDVHRPLVAVLPAQPHGSRQPPSLRYTSALTPVFARHWVQSRGPAPAGAPPVAVHLHPPPGGAWDTGPSRWRVTLAATGDVAETAELAVVAPNGWKVQLDRERFTIGPGAWAETELVVTTPGRPEPGGHHVVRVVGTSSGGQASYDEHIVSFSVRGPAIELTEDLQPVRLTRGEETTIVVPVANHTDAQLWAELDVLSPWGSWTLLPVGRRAVTLPPDAVTEVPVPFRVPLDHPHGSWWWLARVCAGPLVAYSSAAALTVQ